MHIMRKFFVFALLGWLSGCSVEAHSENPQDIMSSQDSMDIARCSGSSKPDLRAMTAVQYRLYTDCIIELKKSREKQSTKK